MKFKYVLLLACIVGLFASCSKNDPLKETPRLLLLPTHDWGRLGDAELAQIKLSYVINNQTRKAVPDFKRATGAEYQMGALQSYNVAQLSAIENVKTFYLTYPGGYEDTFHIDYKNLSDKDARKNECYCNRALMSISRTNGEIIREQKDPDSAPIFRFQK